MRPNKSAPASVMIQTSRTVGRAVRLKLMNRRKKSGLKRFGLRLILFSAFSSDDRRFCDRMDAGMNDRRPGERYDTVDVRRADLYPTRIASGRLESGKRTIIECQLENIAVGVRGQTLAAGGASVLLRVIPEGNGRQAGRCAGHP